MAVSEIQTKSVKVNNKDLAIEAYLAMPKGDGPFPAVIVIQEIFGINSHIRDVTKRFALQGYVAIAPAIYQRLAPGFEAGYTPEDIEIGREYKNRTKAEELISDLRATIDYLYSLPEVKTTGIETIGFCFGGHVAYLVATLPEIKATASFYGAGITNSRPGGGSPTINSTSEIKGIIYAFFGLEDASIPVEQVDEIEAALSQNQITHQVFRYQEADHGFFCDQRGSYNQKAALDAWLQVLDLFNKTL